jgi:two-component system response regulator RegX3
MSGEALVGSPQASSEPGIHRVLIVDDEPDLSDSIAWRLEQSGFEVAVADEGRAALAAIERHQPDLVLLDLVLPGMSGIDVLREIRRTSEEVPVILVSGRSEEADRVVALEIGADDFVLKPFSPRELVARIRALLRRSQRRGPLDAAVLRHGDIEIDSTGRRVLVRGEEVQLSAKEFELLLAFARWPDRAFSRAELIELVWPDSPSAKPEATLTEHVSRLRRKIEADPAKPRWVVTVRGLGYCLRS